MSEGGRDAACVFSMPVRSACLHTLRELLSTEPCVASGEVPWLEPGPSGTLGLTKDAARSWMSEQRGGHLFTSVVLSNPVDAKLIRKGKLTGTDIGVNVHRVLEVDRPHVVIGSTPVNIDQGANANVFSDAVAIVLSLSMFSMEDMFKVRLWQIVSTKVVFDDAFLADGTLTPASPDVDVQAPVMAMLAEGKPVLRTRPDNEQNDALDAAITSLHDQGFVELENGEWHATEKAKVGRVTAWTLRPQMLEGEDDAATLATSRVLQSGKPCDTAKGFLDLSRYQLMTLLRDQGWEVVVSQTRKEVRHVARPFIFQADPPNPPNEKSWYIASKEPPSNTTVSQPYLAALAAAHLHGKPVPHFLKNADYVLLCDPEYEAPPRKRRKVGRGVQVDDDEWADPTAVPERKKQPRRPRRRQLPPKPRQPWVDKDEDEDSDDQRDSGSSSSGSSSSSSTSSSSSSSGGTKSNEDTGPKPAPKAVPKTAPKIAPKRGTRSVPQKSMDTRVMFGRHWLTPRHADHQSEPVSWQMSCKHEGHDKCSRELRVSSTASADYAPRVLKAWVVFGLGTRSKPQHKDSFAEILALGDNLPSDADLEAMIQDLPTAPVGEVQGVKVDADNVPKPRKVGGKTGSTSNDVLGGCSAGVPMEVHEIALGYATRGVLPLTTPTQRARNRMAPKTGYYTPEDMTPLLRYGYIHPNLPPPLGNYWCCRSGTWWLASRGG